MVRVDFKNLEEAEDFLKNKILKSEKQYEGYLTEDNTLNLIPGKSTSPRVYVFVRNVRKTQLRLLLAKAKNEGYGYMPVYHCNSFEWNAEHVPGKEPK